MQSEFSLEVTFKLNQQLTGGYVWFWAAVIVWTIETAQNRMEPLVNQQLGF